MKSSLRHWSSRPCGSAVWVLVNKWRQPTTVVVNNMFLMARKCDLHGYKHVWNQLQMWISIFHVDTWNDWYPLQKKTFDIINTATIDVVNLRHANNIGKEGENVGLWSYQSSPCLHERKAKKFLFRFDAGIIYLQTITNVWFVLWLILTRGRRQRSLRYTCTFQLFTFR